MLYRLIKKLDNLCNFRWVFAYCYEYASQEQVMRVVIESQKEHTQC